jgi:dihydropteroate synthase
VITLESLAGIAAAHRGALEQPVARLSVGENVYDTDAEPIVMGVVNVSRDSTYRDSIATSVASAVRMARVMAAQGAQIVDIGAESSTAQATRVSSLDQLSGLRPVIEALVESGIHVSAETYDVEVVSGCLKAGARVLNLTGSQWDDQVFELAAEFEATVVMCFVGSTHARGIGQVDLVADPVPMLLDYFGERIELARSRGVDRIVVDPGLGFYYANLTDPVVRARYQAQVLLNGFRFRSLGVPLCQALPHAFDLFGDQYRSAEGFFATLAHLGRTGVYRTHEVANVVAVLRALREL